MTEYQRIENCLKQIRNKTDFVPKVALVLGSGLGALADEIEVVTTISYSDIVGFPISTVQGHKGRFVFGYIGKVPVVIMQGRVHYYEGYTMQEVVLPIRLMKLLGAEILFLTNAAGGINFDYSVGELMLIEDHISFLVPSPLIGENIEELGVRFPDMTEIYTKALREVVAEEAEKMKITLQKGIYVQTSGPNYENPAEIRMLRGLGADAVGMSTTCEAIAAKHMGMKICGISCISNMACGIYPQPLSHQEVFEAADRVAPIFKELVKNSIIRFGEM